MGGNHTICLIELSELSESIDEKKLVPSVI